MVNEQVTTVELTAGTPQTIEFSGAYPYYWVNNMSGSEVYAALSTPEADSDGTYTIAAGSQLRISGGAFNTKLNLLGSGKVQVIASSIASCPFKPAQGGGEAVTVDSELSETSENPVQNKVVNAALSGKADSSHTHNASAVGADEIGSASAALTNAKAYTDTAIANLINSAPTTLDTLGEIAAAMSENQSIVDALNAVIGEKANESDLTAHISSKSNPHGVTKSQVGLGNVPNVATNDQTPTFTEASSLEALNSGEKLSVSFGKISKAIADLISHINDSEFKGILGDIPDGGGYYKSKYYIQAGTVTKANPMTVTFPVAYKTVPVVVCTPYLAEGSGTNTSGTNYYLKAKTTTTGVTIYTPTGGAFDGVNWVAFGEV